jgi:RNA polymerase sigma-70 factor (ECF subfamily)
VTVDAFAEARPRLVGIAYRMLGSRAEAEDVVGDVAERWTAADRDAIREPEGWLVTVTTRRSLDVLRSARLQREEYPGVWLPEPVATGPAPDVDVERLESLTLGFLVLLERLTPIERAVFVLHDALDYPYATVAEAVGRSEDACRQALHRARRHVTLPARRSAAEREHAEEVASRFMAVATGGDVDALLAALSPDVVVTSDGGGITRAAMRPVVGSARAARFIHNLGHKIGAADPVVVPCELNGRPGAVVHTPDGWAAIAVETDATDRVSAMHIVTNPAKLALLVAGLGPAAGGRPSVWDAARPFRYRHGERVENMDTR